jgi:flagellar basal body-associated protein FliL
MGKAKKKPAAEEEDDEEEDGGGKKKIIMAVGGVAALGAIYNFMLKPAPAEPEVAAAGTEAAAAPAAKDAHGATAKGKEKKSATAEEAHGPIIELDEMILNLDGPEGGYLKIKLALILAATVDAKHFKEDGTPIAKDVAVQFLSSQSKSSLSTAEGRLTAKEELSTLVVEAYHEEEVTGVLITAMVMQ